MARKKDAEAPESKEKLQAYIRSSIAEKAKDVAWWDRTTIGDLVETAIVEKIARLEKARGEPYPPRKDSLKPGRQPGK